MVMRSSRSTRQYVQAAHPYQRPQTGPGLSTARSLMREAQVSGPGPLRFVHHNLISTVAQPPPLVSSAPSTSSVVPSVVPSALPSPASASTGRMPSFGSVAGSPVTQLQQSTLLHASPQIPDNPPASIQPQRKKYVIRTDTHYDPETGILVVMLELPGVEKKDVKLTLSTSRHNRIRQLKVWGVSDPALPVPTADVLSHFPDSCARERRFGEFSRTFSVPPDLKFSFCRENVQAIMKKGILTLKIQLGPPADGSDVQDIPVN
ncbi:hypothetical protein AN958_06575 [Leucoagaricus sp. SymC.cos]|nr:hypothetical protein AN958_06575 [Leucoagaricus sp. SymC.cos]